MLPRVRGREEKGSKPNTRKVIKYLEGGRGKGIRWFALSEIVRGLIGDGHNSMSQRE